MVGLTLSYLEKLEKIDAKDMSPYNIDSYIPKFSKILEDKLINHYEKTSYAQWRLMDAQQLQSLRAYSQNPLDVFGFGKKFLGEKNTEGIIIALNHSVLLLPLKQNYGHKSLFGKKHSFNYPKYALLPEGILFHVPEKVFGEKTSYTSHFLHARKSDTFPP